jgi:formylglycine-generating enzyme required for sulfatase activity
MGQDEGENPDERPAHIVELSSFYVGRTPVTNSQFVQFMNDAHITAEDYLSPLAWTPSILLADGKWSCVQGTDDYAAACQSWVLAQKYCEWLSTKTGRKCRLPTEAEWEYVCRGKEGRRFPWGNSYAVDRKMWGWRTWKADKPNGSPVGSYPEGATPEGVCDLVGYMDEVCSDWYDPEYYAKSSRKNPKGPCKPVELEKYKDVKVSRGGLDRPYVGGPLVVRIFRDSRFLAFLPGHYLPRGWSRGKNRPPRERSHVDGRLGFRVVVEESHP